MTAYDTIEWKLAHILWDKAPWKRWGPEDWMDYLGEALAEGTDGELCGGGRTSIQAGAALTVAAAVVWDGDILLLNGDLEDPPTAAALAGRIVAYAAEVGEEAEREWAARQRRHAAGWARARLLGARPATGAEVTARCHSGSDSWSR